jgi:hypothetical protein
MALFGRDSLITSYQALPFAPELAQTTLRVLAARQGRECDDFRDEEPGKILHELRFGELTAFGERPQSPYYGTADATPLFLILLDEVQRWCRDSALTRKLESALAPPLNESTVTATATATATSSTRRETRSPASRTSAGRTRRIRPCSPMDPSRSSHARRVRFKATSMTPDVDAPGSRASAGTTQRWPSASIAKRQR